jgi:hypothetical protein
MRLWEHEEPDVAKATTPRDYETVGFVIEGKAELHLEDQLVLLEKGDSWVVPKRCKPRLQGGRDLYRSRGDKPASESTRSRRVNWLARKSHSCKCRDAHH